MNRTPLKRTPFKSKKHRRTLATDIQPGVKQKVHERDGGCSIFSGTPVSVYYACCHYISRTKGGLGIEENVFTATDDEHRLFDKGPKEEREEMAAFVAGYLKSKYPGWDESKLVYKRE